MLRATSDRLCEQQGGVQRIEDVQERRAAAGVGEGRRPRCSDRANELRHRPAGREVAATDQHASAQAGEADPVLAGKVAMAEGLDEQLGAGEARGLWCRRAQGIALPPGCRRRPIDAVAGDDERRPQPRHATGGLEQVERAGSDAVELLERPLEVAVRD